MITRNKLFKVLVFLLLSILNSHEVVALGDKVNVIRLISLLYDDILWPIELDLQFSHNNGNQISTLTIFHVLILDSHWFEQVSLFDILEDRIGFDDSFEDLPTDFELQRRTD